MQYCCILQVSIQKRLLFYLYAMQSYHFNSYDFLHLIFCVSFLTLSLASDCLQTGNAGREYSGQINTTISGQPCVQWTRLTAPCYQNMTMAENFCRNPDSCNQDGRSSPWCYTDASDSQWEYCDVPRCDDPDESCSMDLGMGSGAIEDNQITASSFDSVSYAPYLARINSSNPGFWIPACCGDKHYLKIDLLVPHTISKLYIQGAQDFYVLTFNVLYTMDDLVWTAYSESTDGVIKEFGGNRGNNIVPIYFRQPFMATKIVIVPRTWFLKPGIRLEIFGCPRNTTLSQATEVTRNFQQTTSEWTTEDSPYVVRQMISIEVGTTLTIQAGVKIVFVGKESGLNVSGCLQLNGVNGSEVQMISNDPLSLIFNVNPSGNSFWQGVTVNSGFLSCQSQEMKNLIIRGASIGLGLDVNRISLSNVVIRNSQTGVAVRQMDRLASVSFVNCMFDSNQIAINIKAFESVMILSSVFINNQVGVYLGIEYLGSASENNKTLEIRGSTFQMNSYSLFSDRLYDYHSYLLSFVESYFRSSPISMQNYYCESRVMMEIDHCKFNNSGVRLDFCLNYTLLVNNSLFSDSLGYQIDISGNCHSLLVLNSMFIQVAGSISMVIYSSDSHWIRNNTLIANNRLYCIRIGTDTRHERSPGNIFIIGNSFLNNTMDNIISINESSPNSITITDNRFENPLSQCNLFLATFWKADYYVNADRNWWGSSNANEILRRICDFYSNFRSAVVSFASVFSDSEIRNTIDSSEWRNWNSSISNFGGKLTQNVTLNLQSIDSSTITVKSSIHVPRNLELKLMGAIFLNFTNSTGIVVEGILVLSELKLQPANQSGDWGIIFVNSSGSVIKDSLLVRVMSGLSLRNSSLTIINSNLDLIQGISCTGNVPMKLTFSSSVISSSNTQAIQVDANSSSVVVFINESRIMSTSNYDCILILAYWNVALILENSSIASSQYTMAISIRSQTQNSSLTMTIMGSSILGTISSTTMFTNLTASESSFESKSTVLSISTDSSASENLYLTLSNNTFRGDSILDINNPSGLMSSVQLQQNHFISGRSSLILRGPRILDFNRNEFSNSTNSALNIQLRRYYDAVASAEENNAVRIRNNVFRNNGGYNVVGFGCVSFYEYLATIQVVGNTFVDNSASNVLTSNCRGLYLTENIFQNPRSRYDYEVLVPFNSDLVLYATGNFWNASSYDGVVGRIFDEQDDPGVSPVDVSPWFTDARMTSFRKLEDTFFQSEGLEIGGSLTNDTTLRNNGQVYTVVEDIVIQFGKTLSIESGVQLIFKKGGIIVQGTLLAVGTENSWISMSADNNTRNWKGISFQQKFTEEVYRHDSDWWEVLVQSEWKALEFQANDMDNQKRVAEVICKQAGFFGAKEYGPYDCTTGFSSSSRTPLLSSPPNAPDRRKRRALSEKSPPCDDPTQRVQVTCSGNENSIAECNFQTNRNLQNNLLRLVCSTQSLLSKNAQTVYKIVVRSGAEVKLSSNDSLVLYQEEQESRLSSLFIAVSPCLASTGTPSCISLMSLGKPGWFLRHLGQNQLLLEPKVNPSNSSTFVNDSSFIIREDRFFPSYIALEAFNLPEYYVSVLNNSKGLLVLQKSDNTSIFSETASFKLVEAKTVSKRRKRDTSGFDPAGRSLLKFVKISSAVIGIAIDGKAPNLDNVIVEKSVESGILQTGYAFGNFTIANSEISYNDGAGITLTTNNKTYAYEIYITGCKVINNAKEGIIHKSKTNLTVANCTIQENARTGVDIRIDMFPNNNFTIRFSGKKLYGNSIVLQNNTLSNLSSDGVRIQSDTYEDNMQPIITIANNTFTNVSGTPLVLVNTSYTKSIVQNNTFILNTVTDRVAVVSIDMGHFYFSKEVMGYVRLIGNTFRQNSAQRVLEILIQEYVLNINFSWSEAYSNLFVDNSAKDSTIFVGYHRINITNNIFENPQTMIDLKIGFINIFEENCTCNWWGSANPQDIASRIYDNRLDSSLGLITYVPYLNRPDGICDTSQAAGTYTPISRLLVSKSSEVFQTSTQTQVNAENTVAPQGTTSSFNITRVANFNQTEAFDTTVSTGRDTGANNDTNPSTAILKSSANTGNTEKKVTQEATTNSPYTTIVGEINDTSTATITLTTTINTGAINVTTPGTFNSQMNNSTNTANTASNEILQTTAIPLNTTFVAIEEETITIASNISIKEAEATNATTPSTSRAQINNLSNATTNFVSTSSLSTSGNISGPFSLTTRQAPLRKTPQWWTNTSNPMIPFIKMIHSPTPAPSMDAVKQCQKPVDIVLVIDVSNRNITNGLDLQDIIRNFTFSIVNFLKNSSDLSRIGLVIFSSKTRVMINMSQTNDAGDFEQTIKDLQFEDSERNIAEALSVARNILFSSSWGARHGVAKALVLLSQGNATSDEDKIEFEATITKLSGVKIFSIGLWNEVNEEGMKRIVSFPNETHYFSVSDYSGLIQILPSIIKDYC